MFTVPLYNLAFTRTGGLAEGNVGRFIGAIRRCVDEVPLCCRCREVWRAARLCAIQWSLTTADRKTAAATVTLVFAHKQTVSPQAWRLARWKNELMHHIMLHYSIGSFHPRLRNCTRSYAPVCQSALKPLPPRGACCPSRTRSVRYRASLQMFHEIGVTRIWVSPV
jgi:hypothetical protein